MIKNVYEYLVEEYVSECKAKGIRIDFKRKQELKEEIMKIVGGRK